MPMNFHELRGWTCQDLARATKRSLRTVSHWESATDYRLDRICLVCGEQKPGHDYLIYGGEQVSRTCLNCRGTKGRKKGSPQQILLCEMSTAAQLASTFHFRHPVGEE